MSRSILLRYLDNEEDDNVLSLRLKFNFRNRNFSTFWGCMQTVGWRYVGGKYISPNGRTFADSAALVTYLDQYAIPDCFGNLQSDESESKCFYTDEDEVLDEGRRLRNDILDQLLTNHPIDQATTNDSHHDSVTSMTLDHSAVDHGSSLRRSNRVRPVKTGTEYQSETMADKGTGLYLQKSNLRRSQKPSQILPLNTNDGSLQYPTIQQCIELAKKCPLDEVEAIEQESYIHFAEWRFLLSTNHSLLFFGIGSKYSLLEHFCREELDKEGYILSIDGFDKEASIDDILDLIVTVFLGNNEPTRETGVSHNHYNSILQNGPSQARTVVERAIAVSRALAVVATKTLVPIFLVIHNIEGESLRNEVAQFALSALVANSTVDNGVRSVRLVASVDHLNAPVVLWNSATIANYAWMWKNVNTHRPYTKELTMISDHDVQKRAVVKRKLVESEEEGRALAVLQHLAPRHAEVVHILAQLQLEQPHKSKWVNFKVFWERCKSKWVVSRESQLRTYLSELSDHQLIISRIEDSSSFVTIPYSDETLKSIAASMGTTGSSTSTST